MNNDTLQPQTVNLTPEIVRSKLQICLTKAEQSVQALHDAESRLTYNEDNLGLIKLFIENGKAILTTVEKERVKLKEPSLIEGKAVDAGAKLVTNDVQELVSKVNAQYQKLCQEVEKKRQAAEREAQRKAGILSEIDNFFINQSQAIAAATTLEELVRIQKLIGSHKAASRYGEYLPLMAQKASNLEELIKVQKEAIKILTALKGKEMAAEAIGDDETVLAMREQQETITQTIEQGKIDVQEVSVNMASQPTESATVILPLIPKGGRKLVKWILEDEKAAIKKGWTKIVLNEELVDEFLKENRDKIVDETGIVEGGVRFFIQKNY